MTVKTVSHPERSVFWRRDQDHKVNIAVNRRPLSRGAQEKIPEAIFKEIWDDPLAEAHPIWPASAWNPATLRLAA